MTDRGTRRKFDDLARAIIRPERIPARMIQTTSDSGAGGDDAQLGVWANPMTDVGDIIRGDESGSAVRLAIGTEGQVLTVIDDAGDLVPSWEDATGGSGGQYRLYTLVSDGSGGFEFIDDGFGDPVYTLEDLE